MLKKITSVSNPIVVEYSKLTNNKYRNKTNLFIVEGEKPLIDIIESNIAIKNIFAVENFEKINKLPQEKLIMVTDSVMKKLSTSDTAPKILTVAFQKKLSLSEFQQKNKLLLIDKVSDPGNLGTIIRSAAAFGFEGIIFVNNCVDPYNPKVIRSAAGNFFKIPFVILEDTTDIKKITNFQFIMTDLHSEKAYLPENIELKNKFILTFGNEAQGISKTILEIPHDNVKIQTMEVESLNVAAASSIIMYELSKRSRK